MHRQEMAKVIAHPGSQDSTMRKNQELGIALQIKVISLVENIPFNSTPKTSSVIFFIEQCQNFIL